ncbi:hypothetical protein RRSWK_03473 [Rhodopirellula sp. SWK7]|nr:hypothetical protein RRSWK_03473 [Rhodopirellula sp. SWK7]
MGLRSEHDVTVGGLAEVEVGMNHRSYPDSPHQSCPPFVFDPHRDAWPHALKIPNANVNRSSLPASARRTIRHPSPVNRTTGVASHSDGPIRSIHSHQPPLSRNPLPRSGSRRTAANGSECSRATN